jgi:hypothetical protein
MVASVLARLMGKGLSKTGKKESSEVAKKGTEIIGRRPEKDMGMVEEVTPKRISGPKADEAKESAKRGGGKVAAIAGAAAAGAAGAAVLSSGKSDKESKGSESKGRSSQEDRPERDAGRVSAKSEETNKAKESDKKPSTFGAAFKEARSAGKDTFTFEGKKYTTELASEKKAAPKSTGVREGRNENIDDDTRKRAMASVAKLAKGGMVKANCGASMPPAQKAKK